VIETVIASKRGAKLKNGFEFPNCPQEFRREPMQWTTPQQATGYLKSESRIQNPEVRITSIHSDPPDR